jgi:hypothetical protein
MASGGALGKANETSGLTEPARYSIYRVDAHAEKPTGDPVWLKHGAESWLPKRGVVRLMSLSAPGKEVQAGGVLGPLGEAEEALGLARGVRHDGACPHRPKDS